MNDLEPKEAGEKCNARRTDGSGYCGQPAGWGTDHTGHGRCKFHGGNTANQEKHLIDELEDAAEHGAMALRLRLKHIKEQVEAGEHDEVEWQELDRLLRTAADRSGHGPTEKREVTGDDGGSVELSITRTVVGDDGD